jgi:methionyl-tRNA formyltransferase
MIHSLTTDVTGGHHINPAYPIQRVLFIGSKPSGLQCLKAMHRLAPSSLQGVLTIDDSNDTRTAYPEFVAFADASKVPLWTARSRQEANELIMKQQPELCIVQGWYWLLNATVLNSVIHGFLGIHYSLLPKYRGSSPLVWQIINGEHTIGLSAFYFTPGMDEGDVVAQRSVPLGPDESVAEALCKLERETVRVLEAHYCAILEHRVTAQCQDHSQATYCSQREPEDGVIDWTRSARDVHNFIRAQSAPYPGAFTDYNGAKLTIWRARRHSLSYFGRPGQVVRIANDGVYVTCGDSEAVILEVVQVEGSGALRADQIIRSVRTRFHGSQKI